MKHRLFKLALFLFLGALVNVAVAWGCAKWINLDGLEETTISSKGYLNGEDFDIAVMQSECILLINSKLTLDWPSVATKSSAAKITSEVSLPFKFVYPSHENLRDINALTRVLTAYGWPKLTLWSGYEIPRQDEINKLNTSLKWTIRSGLRISGEHLLRQENKDIPRALPYRPIWLGFAINTMLYASIIWLPTLVIFTASRFIRRNRGRCIKCGYDLRRGASVGCPECGWGREAEA